MTFHLVAVALICAMFIWSACTGWRTNGLRVLAAEREAGLNSISDNGHRAVWTGVVSVLALSAIALIIPPTPVLLENGLGVLFILFGIADFLVHCARKSDGYFAVIIGTLVLFGNLL